MDNYSISSDEESTSEFDTLGYPGKFIDKRYLLIKKIGSGAFSVVWLTYDINHDNFVVAKIQNTEDYETAMDEVGILNKINKLNTKYLTGILDFFEHEFDSGIGVVLIFELMVGSLGDIMEKDKRFENGFPIEVIKRTAYNITKSIDILNKKLDMTHTDLKPENILVEGVSRNIKEIINKFRSFKFKEKLKKNKMNRKHSNYEEYTIKKLITHMGHYMEDINDSSDTDDSSDSSDNSSDDSSDDSDNDVEFIDEKLLNTINVKLGDFGNCKKNIINEEIQTRYYRAPEVILEAEPYNYKSDIWSLGCTLYELATGDILFDPQKYRGITRDRDHIYLIVKHFGPIDSKLLEKSNKYHVFYTKKGLLKRRDKIEYFPIKENLIKKLGSKSKWGSEDISQFTEFIALCLTVNPDKRVEPEELLQHPFVNKKLSHKTFGKQLIA